MRKSRRHKNVEVDEVVASARDGLPSPGLLGAEHLGVQDKAGVGGALENILGKGSFVIFQAKLWV